MPDSKKVRVAQVGLGNFGRALAASIRACDNLDLVACFTRNVEVRKKFVQEHGCEEKESYEALLSDDRIDAVVLTTANHVHCEQALLALQHGKHVFVDKPIANKVDDGIRMVQASREAGRVLAVGHNVRRRGEIRKMKALIADGFLGDVVLVEGQNSWLGDVAPGTWRWHADKCPGGPLMQLGIHHVDSVISLLGPVEEVYAEFDGAFTDAETPDLTLVSGKLISGARFKITASYVISQNTEFNVYGRSRNLLATFEKQQLICQEVQPDYSIADTPVEFDTVDTIREELAEFGDCVLHGRQPEVGGREAIQALAVVEAAIESAESGRPVRIDSILSNEFLTPCEA